MKTNLKIILKIMLTSNAFILDSFVLALVLICQEHTSGMPLAC